MTQDAQATSHNTRILAGIPAPPNIMVSKLPDPNGIPIMQKSKPPPNDELMNE